MSAHALADTPSMSINVPAGELVTALETLAKQSAVDLVFQPEQLKSFHTPGVKGTYTPQAAVRILLKDTPLELHTDPSGAMIIAPAHARPRSTSGENDKSPVTRDTASSMSSGERLRLAQTNRGSDQELSSVVGPTEATENGSQSRSAMMLEEVLVTGSRIRYTNPTAPLIVIDRDTIDKRGFSSAEDIIRALPENMATMNSARSVTQPVGGDGLGVGPAAQGEVTANLRGIGQSATLVLINGRRTSGSAAFSGSSVNLASIPAAAIERVEILTDSAAAVYGSDAIAGVVNVVLRRNYQGASSSIRYEAADNGGDKRAFDQMLGAHWDSGSAFATFSVANTGAIPSARIGYVTNNLTSRGGVDVRSSAYGQPGGIRGPAGFVSLPTSFDGTENWTANDLTAANFQAARADIVPADQASSSDIKSFYLSGEQNLSDWVTLYGDVQYSQDHESALGVAPLFSGAISPANPYNKSGGPLAFFYAPIHEVQSGLIPAQVSENSIRTMNINAGLTVDLPVRDWKADVVATRSAARNHSGGMSYSQRNADLSPTELGLRIPLELNPFGNGSAQNIELLKAGYGPTLLITDRETTLDGVTLSAEGGVLTLPAGDVRLAAGGEYRVEKLAFGAGDYIAAQTLDDPSPQQAISAVFIESSIPLMRSVTASLQARWEQYRVETTDATVDGRRLHQLSPRFGVSWRPVGDLNLRASWGRSFKAPNLANLVIAQTIATDPGPLYDPVRDETVPVYFDGIANTGLKPQKGTTATAGFDWTPRALQGFRAAVTFNDTRFYDQIVASHLVLGTLGTSDILSHPELFPGVAVRDPDTGTLLRFQDFPFNVSSVKVKALDFELSYARDTAWGNVAAGLQGTYNFSYDQEVVSLLGVHDLAGTTDADRLAGVVSLGWSRGGMGVNLYGNYMSSYDDTELDLVLQGKGLPPSDPPLHVPTRVTWDLTSYYEFAHGVKVTGGVRNLLNAGFPFAQGQGGPYDTRRIDLRGRLLYLQASKNFAF